MYRVRKQSFAEFTEVWWKLFAFREKNSKVQGYFWKQSFKAERPKFKGLYMRLEGTKTGCSEDL